MRLLTTLFTGGAVPATEITASNADTMTLPVRANSTITIKQAKAVEAR
jgi:hypothetical protein